MNLLKQRASHIQTRSIGWSNLLFSMFQTA